MNVMAGLRRGVTAALCVLAAGAAVAQDKGVGKATYEAACVACHGSGILGAPKFGDAQKNSGSKGVGASRVVSSVIRASRAASPS